MLLNWLGDELINICHRHKPTGLSLEPTSTVFVMSAAFVAAITISIVIYCL